MAMYMFYSYFFKINKYFIHIINNNNFILFTFCYWDLYFFGLKIFSYGSQFFHHIERNLIKQVILHQNNTS